MHFNQSSASLGPEVIRRRGVSPQTYYAWKAKHAGMEVSEARRLKQLEEERRLKRLVMAVADRRVAVTKLAAAFPDRAQ